jgi:DNA-directed RNA polymerase subunit RPC12/RpoP
MKAAILNACKCGNRIIKLMYTDNTQPYVQCTDCGAKTKLKNSPEEAIDSWNLDEDIIRNDEEQSIQNKVIQFEIYFNGDSAAGLPPFSQSVTITLEKPEHADIWEDFVEMMRETLSAFYDGATVQTKTELDKQLDEQEISMGGMSEHPVLPESPYAPKLPKFKKFIPPSASASGPYDLNRQT